MYFVKSYSDHLLSYRRNVSDKKTKTYAIMNIIIDNIYILIYLGWE